MLMFTEQNRKSVNHFGKKLNNSCSSKRHPLGNLLIDVYEVESQHIILKIYGQSLTTTIS